MADWKQSAALSIFTDQCAPPSWKSLIDCLHQFDHVAVEQHPLILEGLFGSTLSL